MEYIKKEGWVAPPTKEEREADTKVPHMNLLHYYTYDKLFRYVHTKAFGIPMTMELTEDRIKQVQDMEVREDDLFIVTYPKSGTTWTQNIVKLLVGYHNNDETILSQKVNEYIPWMEHLSAEQVDQLPKNKRRIFKSHGNEFMLPKDKSKGKYIYIARNSKDVLCSFFHHHQIFKKFYEYEGDFPHFFNMFYYGELESGSQLRHVKEWYLRFLNSENVLFLTYEEMKDDTKKAVGRIYKFIYNNDQINMDNFNQVVDKVTSRVEFNAMKKDNTANYSWHENIQGVFLRKGNYGTWKEKLTEEQSELITKLYEKEFSDIDLKMKFEE